MYRLLAGLYRTRTLTELDYMHRTGAPLSGILPSRLMVESSIKEIPSPVGLCSKECDRSLRIATVLLRRTDRYATQYATAGPYPPGMLPPALDGVTTFLGEHVIHRAEGHRSSSAVISPSSTQRSINCSHTISAWQTSGSEHNREAGACKNNRKIFTVSGLWA